MIVRVRIRVPRELDDEAAAAVDGLERLEDPSIRKELFS